MTALVVFDWNGTVMDDVERATRAAGAILRRRGRPAPDAQRFRDMFRLPLSALFADLGLDESELAVAEQEWNAEMLGERAGLTAGVAAALTDLAAVGRRLGVISAAATAGVLRDAAQLGVLEHFEFVEGDHADKAAALRDLVVAYEMPVVYIGDTEYDMTSATAAGAIAIGHAGGYRPASALRASGAVRIVDRMAELPGVIDDLIGTPSSARLGG